MPKVIFQIKYEILPDKREDYMTIMKELKTLVSVKGLESYSVFEVKNKNNFNLFNLTINYNLNLKSTKWLQERIVIITDVNGEKHKVGQFLSTGSGLYLGISKNIYFNRIFKRNKTTANI